MKKHHRPHHALPARQHTAIWTLSLLSLIVAVPAYAGTDEAGAQGDAHKDATSHSESSVQLGGFIAAETVSRTRSEMSDVSSATANIPFPNRANYNYGEFHASARQSRLSILAQREQGPHMKLGAYYEIDFMGASSTSNLQQSNSYLPRMRHLYATVDSDNGVHFLAGQSWSLVTMHNHGMLPRSEWTPLRIDSAYVPGWTWTRQDQLRLVKDWDRQYWAGISLENPQTTFSTNGTTPPNLYSTFPASNLNSSTAISISNRPDLVAKVAADTSFGHYEFFGLNRSYQWTAANGLSAQSASSNAVGASTVIPLFADALEANLSILSGRGIGRYGSAQLADVTFDANGNIVPLRERQLLGGFVWHADADWDIYLYDGEERAARQFSSAGGKFYGYGNPGVSNAGCVTLGGTCAASIEKVSQVSFGFWWRIYQERTSKMQFGVQYSLIKVSTFADATGLAPSTSNDMLFTSLRYYPF